jgi:PAS domain S-box-containing protein
VLGRRVEMTAIRADGSEFPVELALTRVDLHGEPRFTAFIRDITGRHVQERALRESENRYRALAQSTGHVVWTRGPRGDLEEAADDWYQMTGQSPEEAAGDGWLRVIHPDDRDRSIRLWSDAEQRRSDYDNEYRVRKRDGTYEWWAAHATPILTEDRTVLEWVGWSRNITEKKLAEEALEQALGQEREAADRLRTLDEMKNTFLAAVSHELRTPLAAVLGAALTLEREDMTLSPEVTGELVHGVAVNARRLDRLLSELLDVDRLSRGILTPQFRATDVGNLVRRSIEQSEAFGERPISVETESVVAPVDPAKVERIVENLVANAVRHSSPECSIWVRVSREDGGVLIVVEDDGPGVPDGYRESIFEPFRRGPNTPAHVPGTGIGLSLVSGFAELHGGRAWVQERDGGGSSFRVFLPGRQAAVLSPGS